MRVRVEGVSAVHFCGNDYLGLARDPRLKQAAIDAIQRDGVGSSASRLVSGTTEAVRHLEDVLPTSSRLSPRWSSTAAIRQMSPFYRLFWNRATGCSATG